MIGGRCGDEGGDGIMERSVVRVVFSEAEGRGIELS
jgi:hypothetical protein